jgi:hypothetical protein
MLSVVMPVRSLSANNEVENIDVIQVFKFAQIFS